VASFNQSEQKIGLPRGRGWRRLDPPVTVRGYIASQWHDLVAVDVNDETREIRVEWPPPSDEGGIELITHRVLTPDHYQGPEGALASA